MRLFRLIHVSYACLISGLVLLALAACLSSTPVPSPNDSLVPSHLPSSTLLLPTITPEGPLIRGVVLDAKGQPIPGATVRIQAITNQTLTDDEGRFTLTGLEDGIPVTVSAWADGYYCTKVEGVTPPASDVEFNMRLIQTNDNPDYEWVSPIGENSCYSCKPGVTQVWLESDAHGRSATNIRFLTMYYGTDVKGIQSPLTRYAYNRDYGSFPLRPDPTQPYYGPGYKLDFPGTAGNCATCHIPGAALTAPYGIDPATVSGVDTFGIHCDYCHKIADVTLDPSTGLPYPNLPGILSQDVRRPFPEDELRYQLFFGSFDDDNVPMEDTYLPLIQQSQFCASCHYGVFWDTVVYNSFGEWLASPYSDVERAQAAGLESSITCQQCHMSIPTLLDGEALTNVAPGMGGVERDPLTIPAHTFPGASSSELLENAVTLSVSAHRQEEQIIVDITIFNDKTGHSVPTDSPLRQMILLVEATDPDGSVLDLVDGPTLPDWAGIGDPAEGYYADLPGLGYAKILMELWTEFSPTGAYWNPTRIVSDNRIPAFGSDTSSYTFATPPDGSAYIQVTLLYRRAFIQLMDWKGWDVPDIVMETESLEIP
jgi:hypothetical protein